MTGGVFPQAVIVAAQGSMIKWRVPASVSLAQWAIESAWGAHAPANNPFGIKALQGYGVQTFTTHESVRGHLVVCEQRFATFPDMASAFECHARLIASAPVYGPAMKSLPDLVKFVNQMAAHYATDPQYAAKIMAVIKRHDLTRYDI